MVAWTCSVSNAHTHTATKTMTIIKQMVSTYRWWIHKIFDEYNLTIHTRIVWRILFIWFHCNCSMDLHTFLRKKQQQQKSCGIANTRPAWSVCESYLSGRLISEYADCSVALEPESRIMSMCEHFLYLSVCVYLCGIISQLFVLGHIYIQHTIP